MTENEYLIEQQADFEAEMLRDGEDYPMDDEAYRAMMQRKWDALTDEERADKEAEWEAGSICSEEERAEAALCPGYGT